MRNLSRREAVLIYTAVLLLVFYVGHVVFVIPAKSRYEETGRRFSEVLAEKESLENRLNDADAIRQEYHGKKQEVQARMERFTLIFTDTGLEQYLLERLKLAGLEPVKTRITARGPYAEQGYLSGGMEVQAEGSYEAAVGILDDLKENPVLFVESYVLYPEEGDGLEQWNITMKITYWLPPSWEEARELVAED